MNYERITSSEKLKTLLDNHRGELLEFSSLTKKKVNQLFPDRFDHFVDKFENSKTSHFKIPDPVVFFSKLDDDNQKKLLDDFYTEHAYSAIDFFKWMKFCVGSYSLSILLDEDGDEIHEKWIASPVINFFFGLSVNHQKLLIQVYAEKKDMP